jgi:hypothetical protein
MATSFQNGCRLHKSVQKGRNNRMKGRLRRRNPVARVGVSQAEPLGLLRIVLEGSRDPALGNPGGVLVSNYGSVATLRIFCADQGLAPEFQPRRREHSPLLHDSQTQAPPSERGFFFAARATHHPPASLLRARLRFATGQRDSFSKSVCVYIDKTMRGDSGRKGQTSQQCGRWSFGGLLLDDDAAAALGDRINIEVECVDD